jgi:30S ribosomal protein S31
MGKGDKKTRKGKIAMGSFGKTRLHHVKKITAMPLAAEEGTEAAPKAEKAKKPSA